MKRIVKASYSPEVAGVDICHGVHGWGDVLSGIGFERLDDCWLAISSDGVDLLCYQEELDEFTIFENGAGFDKDSGSFGSGQEFIATLRDMDAKQQYMEEHDIKENIVSLEEFFDKIFD